MDFSIKTALRSQHIVVYSSSVRNLRKQAQSIELRELTGGYRGCWIKSLLSLVTIGISNQVTYSDIEAILYNACAKNSKAAFNSHY